MWLIMKKKMNPPYTEYLMEFTTPSRDLDLDTCEWHSPVFYRTQSYAQYDESLRRLKISKSLKKRHKKLKESK